MRGRWLGLGVVLGACAPGDEPCCDTDTDTDASVETDTDTIHTDETDVDSEAPVDTGVSGHRSSLAGGPPVVCLDPERRPQQPAQLLALDVPPPPRAGLAGGAVALGDVDGDGDLDLVGAVFDRIAVWKLSSSRTLDRTVPFALESAGLDAGYVAVSLVDVDDDGDLDVFATGRGVPRVLLRNDGTGAFTNATAGSGLDALPVAHGATGQAWSDLDGDGDLDLVVGGHGPLPADVDVDALGPGQPSFLFWSNGDGTFTDGSDDLPSAVHDGWTLQPLAVDPDGDGDDDLLFVNAFGDRGVPNQLVWNDGGAFRLDDGALGWDDALLAGGAAAGDVDGDGREDLLLAGRGHVGLRLSGRGWEDVAATRGLLAPGAAAWGWGPAVADLDNDGRSDVAVPFGAYDVTWDDNPALQPDLVALQGADGAFVAAGAALQFGSSAPHRNLQLADLDRDGWLDLVALGLDGRLRVAFAHCGEPSWLVVRLAQQGRNRDGVGATVRAVVGDHTIVRRVRVGSGFGAGSPPEVHLGLGDARVIDELVVVWPDGEEERWRGVAARRHLTVVRP